MFNKQQRAFVYLEADSGTLLLFFEVQFCVNNIGEVCVLSSHSTKSEIIPL